MWRWRCGSRERAGRAVGRDSHPGQLRALARHVVGAGSGQAAFGAHLFASDRGAGARPSALVVRGAAHYERSCRACHGSPAAARPPLVMKMTPHPPFLPERMGRWDDAEFFQIVKHGIKFTGMPAGRHRSGTTRSGRWWRSCVSCRGCRPSTTGGSPLGNRGIPARRRRWSRCAPPVMAPTGAVGMAERSRRLPVRTHPICAAPSTPTRQASGTAASWVRSRRRSMPEAETRSLITTRSCGPPRTGCRR